MITLTFSPLAEGSQVLVRAAFFRICSDSALRGPEGTLVASYVSHLWQLGGRRCRDFHCNDPVCLRVTTSGGEHQRHGPFQFVRAAEGGLFVSGKCLGVYCPKLGTEGGFDRWDEITLLPAAKAQ